MFGFAIKKSMEGEEVTSMALQVGEPSLTEDIQLNPEHMGQLVVEVHVESDSVQEEQDEFDEDEVEYKLRYSFPLKYTVRGSGGEQVHYEDISLDWNGGGRRTGSGSSVTAEGGSLRVKHHLGRFAVPDDGIVRIETQLEADTRYNATATEGRIHVYGNVADPSNTAMGGMLMFCFAPLIIFVGLGVFAAGFVFGKQDGMVTPTE